MGMCSARAKSGPSGITIVKSRTLMNCTAPTRNTTRRSETLSIVSRIVRCGMTSGEWLQEFLRAHGGVAGTVHRVVAADMMELDAAVNIPPPVQKATRQIPVGKGMAGIAMAEDRWVSTC